MRQLLPLLLFLTIGFSRALAQQPYEQLKFNKYTVNQGLSQNIVEAILQDQEGFMWFGTQDGLNRFDGKNFKTYYFKIDDTSSLSNNYVKTIFEDSKGNLWIGTYGGGLNKFDKKETFERYQYNAKDINSISDNVIYNIHQFDDESLWIGTKKGINQFNLQSAEFKSYAKEDSIGLTNDVIYAVAPSNHKNKIWLGTRYGLNLFNIDTKRVEWTATELNGSALDIRALSLDYQGRLWVGTKGLGLLYIDGEDKNLQTMALSQNGDLAKYVRKIYSMPDGATWVASFGSGLFYIDPQGKVKFNYSENVKQRSLSEDRVVEIYQDRASNFWIGTHGGGLNTFNLSSNKFELYIANPQNNNTLSNSVVNYIYEDSSGDIYIATDKGIDLVTSKAAGELQFKNIIKSDDDRLDERGWLVFEDSKNVLWMGLWNHGLSYYDRKTKKLYSFTNDPKDSTSIASNYVESIEEDDKGNLWVGLIGGGLDYFNRETKTFKHYQSNVNDNNSLSNDRVHSLTYDKKGDLWVATDYGLDRYNKKTDGFDHFRYQPNDSLSLNYNIVRVVFKDSFDNLWIGTGGGGFSKMIEGDNGEIYFKHYTTDDGLPNNNIAGITEDDDHHLWITTYQGMAKFDPVKETFRTFTINDGLQGQEFIRRSIHKTSDGRIFIGGYSGLNVFHPKNISESNYKPQVRLVKLDVYNNENQKRTYNSDVSSLILDDRDYLISFEVFATDYTAVDKNNFRYKLEGFDNEWIDNSNRRHFSYTNLPAGDYHLKVRATNSDGIWSDKQMEVSIKVIPPFWETIWFQILAVLFGGLLIFLYIRWRIGNLRKSKEKLKYLVGERTKEVEITNQKLIQEKTIVNEQKDQITQQHQEIVKQNKIIQKQNDELKLANLQLEEIVDIRTKELRDTNRELYASNHELDTFFYRAAHDLKGPVSTILGLTYLALKENPNEHIEVYLTKVEDTAKRMSNILFNLQKINKIKHSSADISPFKIKTLIDEALEDNIPDNTDKEQFISYELIGIDDFTEIYSDFVLLKIVFSNLFSNAIKFSVPGQRTKVKIRFHVNQELKNYRIIFEDFGVGIPKEFRDKVFDMFFIATDRNPGTGLGLYSVKMAVKKLGGSIIVDPSFDESSGFLMQLPFPDEMNKQVAVKG